MLATPTAPATQLTDGTEIVAWLAQVKSEGTKGRAPLVAALKKIDPAFDETVLAESLETLDPSPLLRTDLFRGQLDSDPDVEAVAQVICAEPGFTGFGERNEEVWIGIFDVKDGKLALAGALHEAIWHCNADKAPLGLTLDFVKGADPALAVVRQETAACGAMQIAFDFRKTEYRISGGKLSAKEVAAPPGKAFEP